MLVNAYERIQTTFNCNNTQSTLISPRKRSSSGISHQPNSSRLRSPMVSFQNRPVLSSPPHHWHTAASSSITAQYSRATASLIALRRSPWQFCGETRSLEWQETCSLRLPHRGSVGVALTSLELWVAWISALSVLYFWLAWKTI